MTLGMTCNIHLLYPPCSLLASIPPYHRYLNNPQVEYKTEKVFILSREKHITVIHFWMYNKSKWRYCIKRFGYQPFRFCYLAGPIVVNHFENDRIKRI